jgi:diguanylate cyclase (GGDEF)-like protein
MASRILIADDDLEVQELLKFTFETEGYVVLAASDGEEAYNLILAEKPDLVVLDVNMPRMTGFEVCEKIRGNPNVWLTPVIILTSLTKTKDRITGIKLGADEYLGKPFEPLELTARAEWLLRRAIESRAANTLSGLPGNTSMEIEIKRRLGTGEHFALLHCDLNNLRVFNSKYGFERGDNVIKLTSIILRSAIAELGSKNDFIAHMGTDDFLVACSTNKAYAIAERAMRDFDTLVLAQYDEDVRKRGYLWGVDEEGRETQYPLITISMGVAQIDPAKITHHAQAVEKAKDQLKKAKQNPKSSYV